MHEHPNLGLDLRGKAFSFSLLTMILSVSLSYMIFIMLRYISCIPALLSYFFIKKNWCLILSNIVSHIYWDDYLTFLILHFVAVAYPLTDLLVIKTSLHLWNQSCLIMVYNLFNILLNLPIFYWGCLHLMVIMDIAHNFLFLWHYDLVSILE